MSSLVLRQHLSLQRFDLEPEDTSSIEPRGTHCAPHTIFRVVGSQYATGPYLSRMVKGLMYRGASFPFTLKRDTPFIGETLR
jgi:hypothetical protein